MGNVEGLKFLILNFVKRDRFLGAFDVADKWQSHLVISLI